MSSLPLETLPIWHFVIIMSGKSHELGVCYHKEGSTGSLYISRAKKKEKYDCLRRLKSFPIAKKVKSNAVL